VPLLTAELIGFALGLLLGSFLNVCISRIPRGESIIHPGSHCPICNRPIRWYDNIPLLSWLILRAKCRDCGTRISWRYPAVELTVALWFLWIGSQVDLILYMSRPETQPIRRAVGLGTVTSLWQYTPSFISLFGLAILGLLLIALIVIDWQTLRLPDALTLPGIATGLFLVCVQAIFLGPTDDQVVLNSAKQLRLSSPGSFVARGNVFLTGPEALIFGRIAAVVGAALILLLIRWLYRAIRHREGLGLGDVKLLAMVAAFLGFWPGVLTLFIGVFLAAVWALFLLARKKADATTRLAFGSFLGVAGLFTALFGDEIITWYRSFL
jgi:leader peptidase (prepilin peptidase)/N-methyltransferase